MRASDVQRSVFWVLEKVERGHGRLRERRRAMDAASVRMRKRSDAGRAIVCRLTAVAGMRGDDPFRLACDGLQNEFNVPRGLRSRSACGETRAGFGAAASGSRSR